MGIDLAIAMATSDLVGAVSQYSAINAQQSSLELESEQKNLAFAQRTANNIATTRQSMETQMVAASGMGESLASPTVKAITLNTFQVGKKNIQNIADEQKVSQDSFNAEESGLSAEKDAIPFKTIGSMAMQGASLKAGRLL